ncbi:MAG: hypothetical protein A2Z16_10230 [Chloroflexi bacterium RBG_16_54_18]|nr:MAG: hypothetical protein A2Z16_10230 [Chloroflexi bacterium RBG_16_54_18]
MLKSSRSAISLRGIGLSIILAGLGYYMALSAPSPVSMVDQYKVLAWNDLGMHCYNRDFRDLAVLPPFNTLWAQVIKVGDPPQIITTGIKVNYFFEDNTYSVGKSNFWTYDVDLFGVDLPDNVGLKGKSLAGQMDAQSDHFIAEGIPLTEFRDSAPSMAYPYQLATIVVQDSVSSQELTRAVVVAPVSTEMHCDTCHDDYGEASEDIATGRVETNILTLHDLENGTTLMSDRPVLCANCHATNALGTPGIPGVPNLSRAMHDQHNGEVPNTLDGCYNCHPGPRTRCLRDVMSQRGMTCIDCHGGMAIVAQNPNPWLNEPRCDNAACHGSGYAQDQVLYRFSTSHNGIYCEGCHDSPHAIAPTTKANDFIKFIDLQGSGGPVRKCTVCHATQPAGAGPHGMLPSPVFLPFVIR